MSAYDRSKLILHFSDLIEQHLDELSVLESIDSGKALHNTKLELYEVVKVFRYFAGWCDKVHGKTIPVKGIISNLF